MKKSYLIGIGVIAFAIGLLLSLTGDVSTYVTFAEAAASGQRVKIQGSLIKEQPMEYDPVKNPNYFSFYLKDKEGESKKVILLSAKPQEFERSESLVLTGQIDGNEFVATEMLMKCPSKYKDEEISIKSKTEQI